MERDISFFIKPIMLSRFRSKCSSTLGIDIIYTNIIRDWLVQCALYAQGRKDINIVNSLRKLANLSDIHQKDNKIITWTLNSKHYADNKGLSHAADFAIMKNNKAIWDIKADYNIDNIPDYYQCAKLAESLGFKSGYRYGDYCHIEL